MFFHIIFKLRKAAKHKLNPKICVQSGFEQSSKAPCLSDTRNGVNKEEIIHSSISPANDCFHKNLDYYE